MHDAGAVVFFENDECFTILVGGGDGDSGLINHDEHTFQRFVVGEGGLGVLGGIEGDGEGKIEIAIETIDGV